MSNIITFEEMEKMSDGEINEIAAVKVMGWKFKVMNGYKEDAFVINDQLDLKFYSEWNPVNDINDAMQLLDKLHTDYELHFFVEYLRIIQRHQQFVGNLAMYALIKATPKQRTIAAILAKEESQ